MKIIKVDQDSEEWLELRKGKISGSKLNDIVVKRGNNKKDEFYQLVADRLAIVDAMDEDAKDRGHRLEVEALEHFSNITGKEVDPKPGVWVSDDNENIILSPDGGIKNKDGDYTQAVEVKCLNAKNHLRAICEDVIPIKFHMQVLQYFIVNEKLKKLYFVFYDPRITAQPLHVIEVLRKEVADEINEYKEYQIKTLKEIDEIVERLAF